MFGEVRVVHLCREKTRTGERMRHEHTSVETPTAPRTSNETENAWQHWKPCMFVHSVAVREMTPRWIWFMTKIGTIGRLIDRCLLRGRIREKAKKKAWTLY